MAMNLRALWLWLVFNSSVLSDRSCSREGSRLVRDYFTEVLVPIFERNHLAISNECVFLPQRSIFHEHESHKVKLDQDRWLCDYCKKAFHSEHDLDLHFNHRHNETLLSGEQAVCLSDYCSIFRCDVLKHSGKAIRSLNPLARGPNVLRRRVSKIPDEHQLTILRSRCASLINQCIPDHLHHNIRMKIQHEMYAEICAYLTGQQYLSLPMDHKPLINLATLIVITILTSLFFIAIGIIRYLDWKLNDNDDDDADKHLSDETISTATALLSTAPVNSIIHSSKGSTSTIRHRVRFKPLHDDDERSPSSDEPT